MVKLNLFDLAGDRCYYEVQMLSCLVSCSKCARRCAGSFTLTPLRPSSCMLLATHPQHINQHLVRFDLMSLPSFRALPTWLAEFEQEVPAT